MLSLPTEGFARSVKVHNISFDIMCDWIECSVFLEEEDLSVTDIADVLLAEEIYEEQGFASEGVRNAWGELKKRYRWIEDNSAYKINNQWIMHTKFWKEAPAQVFCTLLSLAPFYDWWYKKFGSDYNEQGELFELLTKESLRTQFNDWEIYHTGWSRENTKGLVKISKEVSDRLNGEPLDSTLWKDKVKDLDLDLLFYKPFPDNRSGIPVYFMQCASGGNWASKMGTPDLDIWKEIINLRSVPVKAFSAPFAFLDDQFARNCVRVKGLLLDRSRLLNAYCYSDNWVPKSLKDRIVAWSKPRIKVLLDKSK